MTDSKQRGVERYLIYDTAISEYWGYHWTKDFRRAYLLLSKCPPDPSEHNEVVIWLSLVNFNPISSKTTA